MSVGDEYVSTDILGVSMTLLAIGRRKIDRELDESDLQIFFRLEWICVQRLVRLTLF